VVTVADQISLTTGQSSPDVVRARDLLGDVRSHLTPAEWEVGALVEVARSVHEGLLAAADSHRAEMILVGYSEGAGTGEDEREEERFDRTMHRVARKSRTPMVVAKFRRVEMRRVLVPVTASAPLRVTGMLCRALAEVEQTSLTFLHVAAPDESVEAARDRIVAHLRAKGVARLGPLVVTAADDPVDAIVELAERHDMVVLGSGRPGFMSAILSSKAEKIAEEAPSSVLLVRDREESGG
jgi:nucleotide-binding universal stress UspA family protein